MSDSGVERRLSVILAADVVGYSRLMEADEEATVRALNTYRQSIDSAISSHHGRIFGSAGDSVIAEFTSPVEAVRCAVRIQQKLDSVGIDLPDHPRMQLRIGINLGDVIVEGNNLLGDGVNIAARLESIAEPGGITLARSVYDQVKKRLDLSYVDMGEQPLKNISDVVQVYKVMMTDAESAPDENTTLEPLPEYSGKPSIAVLPFTNMSGDPEQEYFSDGITEDLITALSKFRGFFIIARNSTFVFKGQAVDLRQIGRDLGVRYILEGSVRKAANRIRITAQLIDAESGNHVWAERYDSSLEDIFELQDEITTTIAGALEPEITQSERKRALRKPTENLGAWDLLQRGTAILWQQDRTSLFNGMETIRQAVELDPGFGEAYGYLAFGAACLIMYGWSDNPDASLEQGLIDARRAISIEDRDYFAYHALGRLNTLTGDHPAAVRALETCINLNPNFAFAYVGLAEAHVYAGSPKAAISYVDRAVRLSPKDPMLWDMLHYKASAYVRLNDFDRAIEIFEQVCEFPTSQYVSSATLSALYHLQGRAAEAIKALERARRLEPKISITLMKKVYGVTDERPGSRTQRLLDALRATGLAEE